MEMGLGFLMGVLGGSVIAVIVAVIIAVSRRALGGKAEPPALVPPTRRDDPVDEEYKARRSSGYTMIVEAVDSRETILNKNVQEVRDLIVRLTGIISGANAASGKADLAFASARDVVNSLGSAGGDELDSAQRALVAEIDRLLHTNSSLQQELQSAHQGIAEQRRQIEELQVQARIDGLTRIPNRAAFDERLKEYISLQFRSGLTFCLLLMDIDFFKQVNDEHGHVNGDRILRGVAAKISDSIRANDFAARYGGEEFAVILPGTALRDARMVAERIRDDIGRTNFRLDGKLVKLTVSGGLAESVTGTDSEVLIGRADRALYQAKADGRNCLVAAEDIEIRG